VIMEKIFGVDQDVYK